MTCDCGASTCNCVLTAGDNISIFGAGTATSPYVIGATGGNGTGGTGVPTGTIIMWAGNAPIPTGWLECNGQTFARYIDDDPDQPTTLFRAIGTTWGAGDGNSTFNVPQLSGRFPLAAGPVYQVAATGGSSTVTLVGDNLPNHTHVMTHDHLMQHTHGITHRHTIAHVHSGTAQGVANHRHTFPLRVGNPSTNVPANQASEGNAASAGSGNTSMAGGHNHNLSIGQPNNAYSGGSINVASNAGRPSTDNMANIAGAAAGYTGGARPNTTQARGASQAFNIMPPYAAIRFLIRT